MEFNKAVGHVDEVFRLVAKTPVGREVLEAFLPLYKQNRVKIEAYPDELLQRLRSLLGPGQPVGACFVNDGDSGTIYFDPGSVIGVLAPFLVHEMAHSLDKALWKDAHVPISRDSRDQLMLRAETKAFELQHRFVEELIERFPEFKTFLDKEYPRVKVLTDRLTGGEIADLYGYKKRMAS